MTFFLWSKILSAVRSINVPCFLFVETSLTSTRDAQDAGLVGADDAETLVGGNSLEVAIAASDQLSQLVSWLEIAEFLSCWLRLLKFRSPTQREYLNASTQKITTRATLMRAMGDANNLLKFRQATILLRQGAVEVQKAYP